MALYELYTDGGCDPNPGPCASAGICMDPATRTVLFSYSSYLGEGTNNIAELTAIKDGLQQAKDRSITHLRVYSDSELSVELCMKTKQTQKPHLSALVSAIHTLSASFETLEFQWIKAHNHHPINDAVDALCSAMLLQMRNAVRSHPQPIVKKESSSNSQLFLNCPFAEKDTVKALGAKWNPSKKKWTVQDTPQNRETFEKWLSA
jgi:ribonuclease HI